MKKLALVAIAAIFAASGAVSTASASLSGRDGTTVWHQKDLVQVADRGGGGGKGGRDGGGRNDGGKNRGAHKDGKGGKVIWRIRDGKKARPFFLFRGRGDCRTETVLKPDGSTRQAWVCN